MELEELKQAWKELNEKVAQNELTNRSVIVKMLARQKETNIQRLWRLEKVSFVIVTLIAVLVLTQFGMGAWSSVNAWPLKASVVLLVVSGWVMGLIGFRKVKKIREGSLDLEEQLEGVLSFKMFQNRVYIICYILASLVVVLALYYLYSRFLLIALCIIIPLAMLVDYFLYHHISNTLRGISEASRELEEYKKEIS